MNPAMKAAIIAGCVVLSVLCAAPGAHAQILYGDPYDGARIAQRYTSPPNVFYRSPTLQQVYGWGGAPYAYTPPPALCGEAQCPSVVLGPATGAPPPYDMPPALGWIWRTLAPCANPDCSVLTVSVGADGANIRVSPGGPVSFALANGVPLFPSERVGNWVLVSAACALVPTWTFSVTAGGVPLSVCL